MTQTRALYDLFKFHGWKLWASQMWDNSKIIGRKYTGRISDLRAMGFVIEIVHETPETNRLYILKNPEYLPEKWKISSGGVRDAKNVGEMECAYVGPVRPPPPVFKDGQGVFW